MTTSCAGKSHFTNEHPNYAGLPIIDFSKVNKPASLGQQPEATQAPGGSYRDRVIAYLSTQPGPLCVLGRRGPPDPPLDRGISYAAILLPEAEHRRNWASRKAKRPHSRWQEFSDLGAKREKLRLYAEEHGFPIYESFARAIEELAAPVDP